MYQWVALISLFLLSNSSTYSQDIYRTACNGDIDRLDSLLQYHLINTQDDKGRSLLHWAVACRQKAVFDWLIDQGIDINSVDNQLKTPLHIAVNFNNPEYVDHMISVQPTEQWKVDYGGELLSLAVVERNEDMIKQLIDYGIDVNQTNAKGNNSLEVANRLGASEISKFLIAQGADSNSIRPISYNGLYLDDHTPGTTPMLFAPNFISVEEYEFGSVFNSDMSEFYYGVDVNGSSEIRVSYRTDGGDWSVPEVLLSHESYGYNDPFLSPDDNRLYFISQRPLDGSDEPKEDHDIWYVQRESHGWSEPINAGPNINTIGAEYYISFTSDGTMYFATDLNALDPDLQSNMDIHYSKYINGSFKEPVRLGSAINTKSYEADVFIDPLERYIIFCSTRRDGLGRGDLYISYKNSDGSWTPSINMGAPINTANHELCPYVTPDGKYLMYTSNEDIYWVSTDILEQLRR